jgi:hypothetical protein
VTENREEFRKLRGKTRKTVISKKYALSLNLNEQKWKVMHQDEVLCRAVFGALKIEENFRKYRGHD